MSTIGQLETLIDARSRDTSFNSAAKKVLLNEAALYIAEKVRLPSLAVGSDTVDTDGTGLIAMPVTYHYWLYRCNGGTNNVVAVRDGYEELVTIRGGVMTAAGAVADVSVQGPNLYYQPIPAAPETLTLFYSNLPTVFTDDADIPTFLPTLYHKTLAWYALREIFNEIEKDIDGSKPWTDFYSDKLDKDIADLRGLYNASKG